MPTEGYLIVLHPAAEVHRYNIDPMLNRMRDSLYRKEHKIAFEHLNPVQYRGISRYPLRPDYEDKCPEHLFGIDIESSRKASARLREIIPSESLDDIDEILIPDKQLALEVFSLLGNPGDWELLHVRCENFRPHNKTYGFDVGYWGEDFSLIADTALLPRWHPPIPEDFAELIQELAGLNTNLLFKEPDSAIRFRQFYKSKPWAETDATGDEFHIIQVDAVMPTK